VNVETLAALLTSFSVGRLHTRAMISNLIV
jgi:hypothetical protein